MATLGNVEENDTVSRALARLSEVEEKVETLHSDQVGTGQIQVLVSCCYVCCFFGLVSLDSEGSVPLW